MLQCFLTILRPSRRPSSTPSAPCISATCTSFTSLCLYYSTVPRRGRGKDQYKIFWYNASDKSTHSRPVITSSIRSVSTNAAEETAGVGKGPLQHVKCLPISSPEKLVSQSAELASPCQRNAREPQSAESLVNDTVRGRRGSPTASRFATFANNEDRSLDSCNSGGRPNSAVPGVETYLSAKNDHQPSYPQWTSRADGKRGRQMTKICSSEKNTTDQSYLIDRLKRQHVTFENGQRSVATREISHVKRAAVDDAIGKENISQNIGVKRLLRRFATSRLPKRDLLTWNRLPTENSQLRGILRGMYNKARRLGTLEKTRRSLDSELIENEIARRLSSLYPYTRSHLAWVKWFRLLIVPSLGRDRSWDLWNLFITGKEGAQWVVSRAGSENFLTLVSQDWVTLSQRQKGTLWPTAMLQCLMTSAHVSVNFLEATLPISYSSFEMLADSLWAINVLYAKDLATQKTLRATFNSLTQCLFDFKSWPSEGLQERHLGLMLEFASVEQASMMFSRIVEKRLKHLPSDMLRFMDKFTQANDVKNSLEALYSYSRRRTHHTMREKHMSTRHVLSRCTNLLKLDSVAKQRSSQNFMILPEMLKMGVNPDQILYNVVIDNAFKNDVSEVGWDVFRFLKANDMPRDSYTYIALLKDGLHHHDSSKITEILAEVFSNPDVRINDPLLSYVLHVVRKLYWLRDRCTNDACYRALFSVYSKYRSLVPLLKLGLHHSPLETEQYCSDRPLPSRETLGVMLITFIFSRHYSSIIFDAYQRFRHLLHANDPQISMLAESDHVYNAFVSCLSREHYHLADCLAIVQDMLRQPKPGLTKPTYRTYELLIAACVRHGEIDAAERVRRVMRKQGVEENDYIRKKVADGYALSEEAVWKANNGQGVSSSSSAASAFWEWDEEESLNDADALEFSELIEKLREMRDGETMDRVKR